MPLHALQTKTMLKAASQDPVTDCTTQRKSQLPSKKRRETICGLGNFNEPFTIRPCPKSPYDKPFTLRPIRVIGRSQLPLSFLDTSSDQTLPTNRLFAAYIDVLEKHHDTYDREEDAPKVLISCYETKRTLYAVERVQARVYSLCKLADWLKEKNVADLWDPGNLEAYPNFSRLQPVVTSDGEWWHHATVETQPVESATKTPRLSMLRPQAPPAPIEAQNIQPTAMEVERHDHQGEPTIAETAPMIVDSPILPTPQEQLESLVEQYLNSIYMSKTSLAYFAKGPITRIRNAFTSPEHGAPPTHELVTFLRSMLLSHKAEEKKYREKLEAVIKAIPPGCFSDEDLAEVVNKPKKSKKKSLKLNREGLYPHEEDIIRKWWISEMPSPEAYGEETVDQRIKRRLADLRVREALAQMILILEIIALETLSTYKPPAETDFDAAGETQVGELQVKLKKRKKKLDDVNILLDLLLDKLCIWQSVEQEGVLDFGAKHLKKSNGEGGAGQAGSNDRLQSFCVEVIIPFYMNRLPDQARMVNKKLGGPTSSSPPKRKAMRPPTTSRKSGEPKEPEAKKARRALARVSTDITGQTGQGRVTPSLHRSATDSALMSGIKREGSEVPLSAIPFQRSPSNAARQSLSHFKLLKGREIDLTATSATAAAKLKQKKRVEEDLKEAITALKKPNRDLAVGGYVDEIEKRGLGASNRLRKPANPVRRLVKDVQVSATPRAARKVKHVVEQTPTHPRNPFVGPHELDAPPSSDFCVPSSAVRPTASIVPATVKRSITDRKLAGPGVAETPSKPSSAKTLLTSPTSRMSVFDTPSKSRAESPEFPVDELDITPTKAMASSPPKHVVATPMASFATPSKRMADIPVAESPLPTSSNPGKDTQELSIYDALGWNDDVDPFYHRW